LPDLAKVKSDEERLKILLAHRAKVTRDLKPHEGELPPLPPVTLAGSP
jgi:hypothetical protein